MLSSAVDFFQNSATYTYSYWQRKMWLFGNILPKDRLTDEKNYCPVIEMAITN
jgi:hypothetical protein